jgi:hypothetical protein
VARSLQAGGGFHIWTDQYFFVLAESQVSEAKQVSKYRATTRSLNGALTDFLGEAET